MKKRQATETDRLPYELPLDQIYVSIILGLTLGPGACRLSYSFRSG